MIQIQHLVKCLIFHNALIGTHGKGREMERYVRRIGLAVIKPEFHDIPVLNVDGTGQHPIERALVVKTVDILPLLISPLIKKQHLINTDLLKGRRRLHRFPDLQDRIKGIFHIQQHMGKAQAHPADRFLLLRIAFPDIFQFFLSRRAHIAGLVNTVPPGAPGDLLDLRYLQFPLLMPVIFFGLDKNDPPHRKIEPHADGIGGNHHLALLLGKQPDLAPSDLRRERAVDHAGADALPLQTSRNIQHRTLGKQDQRIPVLYILRKTKCLFLTDQLCHPFIMVDLTAVPAEGDQMGHYILCRRAHTDMDLFRFHAQYRSRPGMPPVLVGYHLRLVNDDNVIFLFNIQHLDRGGDHAAVFLKNILFPREHAAGYARLHHPLIYFQRKKTQRSQIGTVLRRFQTFQRLIGLPAVGGSHMQDKMPFHGKRFLKLRLRIHRNHIDDLSPDSHIRVASRQLLDRPSADLKGQFRP